MAEPTLGRWRPAELTEVVELFRDASFRWWISGGRALELHLGRCWRTHGDTDVSVRRVDLQRAHVVMADWDLHVAAAGRLSPWHGEPLDAVLHQNNVWCRRGPEDAWSLDVTISDGSDTQWIYRRDPSIRLNWERAVLTTSEGVPYLAPELQLLFKSKTPRPKDDADARQVIPELDDDRRSRLSRLLPANHRWHQLTWTRVKP